MRLGSSLEIVTSWPVEECRHDPKTTLFVCFVGAPWVLFNGKWEKMTAGTSVEDMYNKTEQKARNEDSGLTDLFGGEVLVNESSEGRYNHFDQLKCLTFRDRLNREKDSLGLFLTGHLVDEYREEFRYFVDSKISDMRAGLEDHTVGGLIVGMRTMKSRRGETIAFVTLDDKSGRVEVSVFGDVFDKVREKLLKDDRALVALSHPSVTLKACRSRGIGPGTSGTP